jgi:ATP-dependent RNA helicase DeaD
MGFREDIEKILSKIPEKRQTALFSATMADDVKKLAEKYLKEPEYIKVASKTLTVASIEQKYYEVKEKTKPDATTRLIDMYNPELTVIFCNTKKRAAEVCAELQKRGYKADALHGDLKQTQRDAVMNKFRNRSIDILVATDVAARGIDVDNVDLVINYDLPQEVEYYVHRIGRTGRAGKSGLALSLVVGKQLRLLKEIMQYTKKKIKLGSLPSVTDVEQYRTAEFLKTVQATIEGGKLEKYKSAIQSITNDEISTEDIAAALLKMAISNHTSDEDETDDMDDLDYDVQSDRRYVKVSITVGKSKGIRIKDIVGALAGECGIPGREFGDIEVYDEFTLAEVPKRYYKDVIKGMKGKKIRGNKVIVSKSKL